MTKVEKNRLSYLKRVVAHYKKLLDDRSQLCCKYTREGDTEKAAYFEKQADLYRARWCVANNCVKVIETGESSFFECYVD